MIARRLLIFVTVLAGLMMMMMSLTATAATFRSGNSVRISRGETIHDDLYIAGNSVSIDGKVEGDVFAAGNTVTISGDISQGVFAAGNTVIVDGYVGGDIRAAGSTVLIKSDTTEDVMVAGANVDIGDIRVGRDVLAAGATVVLDATVERNAQVSASNLELSGEIGGDLKFEGEKLSLARGSVVGGDLTYTSKKNAKIDKGATVRGDTKHKLPKTERARRERQAAPAAAIAATIIFGILWFFVWLIGAMIVGAVMVFIAPHGVPAVADSIRVSPWASLGIGLIVLLIIPPLAIMIGVTLIGLPVALVAIVLYALAVYASVFFSGFFVGRWIIQMLFKQQEPSSLWSMLLGVLLLHIVGVIPFLGTLVYMLAVWFGLGSMVLGLQKIYKTERAQGVI